MKRINYRMNKLLSIIISVILLVVLTSCEQNPTTTKYEPPPDEDASGVSQLPVTEDTFTSDYLPGEENRVGNLWSNTTLCSQGKYIYHYNKASGYIEKWMKTEEPENAIQISYQPDVEGHIEVVGDYIYFCRSSSKTIGNDELYSILRLRTDGAEEAVIVSDCLNYQYRIVDKYLFYLSLEHEQSDASTESFSVRGKQLTLSDIDYCLELELDLNTLPFPIVGTWMEVPYSNNYYKVHNPWDFYVVISDARCMLGYTYDYDNCRCNVCYDITLDGRFWQALDDYTVNTYVRGDTITDTDFWSILYPMEDGSKVFFKGRKSDADTHFSRTYSVSADEWPDISNADLTPITGGISSNGWSSCVLNCVADNKLFYGCYDGLCIYDLETGTVSKVNNDRPSDIQYVGDNKIYYSWFEDGDQYYCCDLEGNHWRKLDW